MNPGHTDAALNPFRIENTDGYSWQEREHLNKEFWERFYGGKDFKGFNVHEAQQSFADEVAHR